MSEMMKLAERVEGLAGPDREVDAAIACLMRWNPYDQDHWSNACDLEYRPTAGGWMACYRGDDRSLAWPSPLYTASLDAAMTLVPETCLAMVKHLWDGPKRWGYAFVSIYRDDAEECDGKMWVTDFQGCAQTQPLALVSAALKSRAHLEGE